MGVYGICVHAYTYGTANISDVSSHLIPQIDQWLPIYKGGTVAMAMFGLGLLGLRSQGSSPKRCSEIVENWLDP